MKKPSKNTPRAGVRESREDRARTLAGKTVNSKVRSEGRASAARTRTAETKQTYAATSAKRPR